MNTTALTYWLSRRLRPGRHTSAGALTGAVIAVAGVALSLLVMLVSMAVSTGFTGEIHRKVAGFTSPVTVLPPADYISQVSEGEFVVPPAVSNLITTRYPAARAVENVTRHALIKTADDFTAVECISHGTGHDDSFERANIIRGNWPDDWADARDSVVISEPIARRMGLDIGDRTFFYFFVDEAIKARPLTVAGIYESHFGEYDNMVVYTSIDMMRRLAGDERAVTALDIEGVAIDRAPEVASAIEGDIRALAAAGRIPAPLPVTDVTRRGALYFNWLELLDTNVVVIFILMLCVASFTLISSLFILILDRVATIGLLRSIGLSRRAVSDIFVHMALRLVGLGLIIGNLLGLSLIYIQSVTHIIPLDPEMYYLSYVPVQISWWSVAALNLGFIAGAWLILILPARIAARIDPATTMRYE